MKRIRIVMDSGKEYIYRSEYKDIDVIQAMKLFCEEDGKTPKKHFMVLTGGIMKNKIVVNPSCISSIEEFEEI